MNQIREFENLSIWQNVWVCFLVRLDSFSLNTSFPEKKKKKLKESIPGPPQDSYFQESNRKSAWVYTVILLHFPSFWDSAVSRDWSVSLCCPSALPLHTCPGGSCRQWRLSHTGCRTLVREAEGRIIFHCSTHCGRRNRRGFSIFFYSEVDIEKAILEK